VSKTSLGEALWGDSPLLKVLALACAGLLLVLAGGTVLALALGLPHRRAADSSPAAAGAEARGGFANYSGLGSMRLRSADRKPALVSLTVVLSIPANDKILLEEIISKSRELKKVCREAVSSKKAADLAPSYEGALKAELRDKLNAKLSLGRIIEVYFPEYQLIE
jgi:flagellar basal body-associated protein FliL